MNFARVANVLVPPGSARGKVLHDYVIEPLALGLGRKGFTHESRELYAWSKARHVSDRMPEEGYPRRLLDRASEYLASVADNWVNHAPEDGAHNGKLTLHSKPSEASHAPRLDAAA